MEASPSNVKRGKFDTTYAVNPAPQALNLSQNFFPPSRISQGFFSAQSQFFPPMFLPNVISGTFPPTFSPETFSQLSQIRRLSNFPLCPSSLTEKKSDPATIQTSQGIDQKSENYETSKSEDDNLNKCDTVSNVSDSSTSKFSRKDKNRQREGTRRTNLNDLVSVVEKAVLLDMNRLDRFAVNSKVEEQD